jgi:hypothetical protein
MGSLIFIAPLAGIKEYRKASEIKEGTRALFKLTKPNDCNSFVILACLILFMQDLHSTL